MKKNILIITLIVFSIFSCSKGGKMGMDFSQIKSEMNLGAEKETQFDAIIQKFKTQREETFSAAKNSGNIDRTAMMEKMRTMIKDQNLEIKEILSNEQFQTYSNFVKKFSNRFNPPGYSKEFMEKLKSELGLDDEKNKILIAINKAFEKSYIDAHDYYHGNNEAAKEYWNKYDKERKKAIKKLLSDEQYQTFLALVKNQNFKGEHGGGDKKESK